MTFSQLKEKYGVEEMYRTTESIFISNTSNDLGLPGVPTSRYTTRPNDDYDSVEKVDTLEPIWYSTKLQDSIHYCNSNKEIQDEQLKSYSYLNTNIYGPKITDCVSYKYIPFDKTLIKEKQILFLDLNGKKIAVKYQDTNKIVFEYNLDIDLINEIYDYILSYYKNQFSLYNGEQIIGVDKQQEEVFTIEEIKAAYGYNTGLRASEHYIDKFFSIELFHLIIDILKLEEELNCVFMGYFHSDVRSANEKGKYSGGVLPAEFAIPYRNAINKNYMNFFGIVARGRTLVSNEDNQMSLNKKSTISGGKKTKRRLANKNKKTKRRCKKTKRRCKKE